jgi:hypothetical protein
MAGAVLLFAQTVVEARQASKAEAAPNLLDDPSAYLDRLFPAAPAEEPAEQAQAEMEEYSGNRAVFSIGVALGFLGARTADTQSVFGQIEVRYWISDFFALKLAGTGYRVTFDHNSIVTRQYPIELLGVLFPFPHMELNPYLSAGVGYFHTTVDYRGVFEPLFQNGHTGVIGYQGGGGVEWIHNSASLFLEGSYVFVDPKIDGTGSTDFYHWKFLVGLTLRF